MPNIPHKIPTFKNSKTGSEFTFNQVDDMIESIAKEYPRLTVWEQDFILDMEERFELDRFVTEKQLAVIENLYTKYAK